MVSREEWTRQGKKEYPTLKREFAAHYLPARAPT